MSQRESGYVRIEADAYETPAWATKALVPHIPKRVTTIYEPAAGSGKMVCALASSGYVVSRSDLNEGINFLDCRGTAADAIITNPPYKLACEFIWQALVATRELSGFVAMLLRCDFDHAKTRLHLFQREQFAKKLILTQRIRWIEGSTGSPSFNHAWFMWDWRHQGPPTLAYGPDQ